MVCTEVLMIRILQSVVREDTDDFVYFFPQSLDAESSFVWT